MRVPREVMQMFCAADHRRFLSSEHTPGTSPPAPSKAAGARLAIEDRSCPGPCPLSPGPGPWGGSAAAASSAGPPPQTPRTRMPTAPLALPVGWTRRESSRTPGLLFYRHEDGRTQFEHPALGPPSAQVPPAQAPTTVVVQQHRSTMVQGALTPSLPDSDPQYQAFLRWQSDQRRRSSEEGPYDRFT